MRGMRTTELDRMRTSRERLEQYKEPVGYDWTVCTRLESENRLLRKEDVKNGRCYSILVEVLYLDIVNAYFKLRIVDVLRS